MDTQKLSFANIKDELSREELKNIMAGSGTNCNSSAPDCPSHKPCEKCDDWGFCYCSDCCLA